MIVFRPCFKNSKYSLSSRLQALSGGVSRLMLVQLGWAEVSLPAPITQHSVFPAAAGVVEHCCHWFPIPSCSIQGFKGIFKSVVPSVMQRLADFESAVLAGSEVK